MAQLVLGVVGATVGFAVGGPAGAAWGWSIGSTAGAALFPADLPDAYGPRLSDLHVQNTTYGSPIPKVWGKTRIAGALIWTSDLIETSHTQEAGGKGGGGEQSVTTYTYSADCAIAVCEGPINGIVRIWANGILIYDEGTLNTDIVHEGSVTIYYGDETQTPSALMESYLGAGNVPAYRGTAFVQFEGIQLEKFGNRLPSFTFEVSASAHGPLSLAPTQTWSSSVQPFTSHTNLVVTADYIFVGQGDGVYVVSKATGETVQVFGFSFTVNTLVRGEGPGSDYVWIIGTPNGMNLWKIDITSLTAEAYSGYFIASDLCADPGTGAIWVAVWNLNKVYLRSYEFDGEVLEERHMPAPLGSRITVDSNHGVWSYSGTVTDTTLIYGDPSDIVHTYVVAGYGNATGIGYDPSRNSVVFTTWRESDSTGWMIEFALASMSVVNAFQIGHTWGFHWMCRDQKVPGLWWEAGATPNTIVGIDLNAGAIVFTLNYDTHLGLNALAGTSVALYGADADLYGPGDTLYSFGESLTNGAGVISRWPFGLTLGKVVSDLCIEANLTDIDVSALTQSVRGYVRSHPMSARAAIEPLQQAYWFDAVETDYALRFIRRGGASVRTITRSNLLADVQGPIDIRRAQELELPREVRVSYLDPGADYDAGAQYERRTTGCADGLVQLELPIVLTATEAKRIAEVNLMAAWLGRTTARFGTAIEHAALDATDVVTLPIAGPVKTARLTKQTIGGFTCRFEAVVDDPSIYSPVGVGIEHQPPAPVPLLPLSATELFLLDVPPLRDADDALVIYTAGGSDGVNRWRGAGVYESNDGGATYAQRAALTAPATHGITVGALADWTGGNVFDRSSTLDVQLIDGTLASASELAVLGGANALAVESGDGWEIVQFVSATLTAPGQYTLAGFLRGRKGTEGAMAGHADRDRFVLLTAATLVLQHPAYAEIASARLYKAVTSGGAIADAPAETFTLAGESLLPLSPVHLAGERDGSNNLALTWIRRTRIDGEWRDGVDAGLGEASEAYDVELWSDDFLTLLRTLSGLSSPAATYSAVDQTADGLTPGDLVGVRVYQLSASIGRGHSAQAIL